MHLYSEPKDHPTTVVCRREEGGMKSCGAGQSEGGAAPLLWRPEPWGGKGWPHAGPVSSESIAELITRRRILYVGK